MVRILLVEDDKTVAKIIRYYLSEEQEYHVTWVASAGEAMARSRDQFDVVLLDIMLPDVDGVELCGALRERMKCPILFLSCIGDDDTIVRALEMGGDDYLTKPVNCKVLNARIHANLRRVELDRQKRRFGTVDFRGFSVLIDEQCVLRDGIKYKLSPIEYGLLMYLIDNPNRTIMTDELYRRVWEKPDFGDTRTVVVHVHNLRKKVETEPNSPRYIQSVRSKGYLFLPDQVVS